MKLKGIVFDLDGTLVDSLPVSFKAFNHGIVTHGGKHHTPSEIMKYFGPGEEQIFAAILGPAQAKSAYAACRRFLNENLEQILLHSEVPELLETLKSRSVPISIFTGRSWNTTEIILKHHRLLDRFITVVANDHVSLPKPAPEGLHLASSRMGLQASDVLFVGDMVADIQAAHAAGSRSVAALWDPTARREELALHSPHHWAETPAQIVDILEY